ncbi:hypothetical protein pdam_00010334 [Pocillopora damicornis]|uniref:F5/8 type C domain-containing protein n=1 Tax=Pocillopora damicornis TaxID=46731 RepID=A0A3M6UCY4_POCDA|nr:hypothetical protein pdam_00010334 [Pocillopora damicornis]
MKQSKQLNQLSRILLLEGCAAVLGVENKEISDANLKVSSQMDEDHGAKEARLNSKADGNKRGGWSAMSNNFNQWLQVDIGIILIIPSRCTININYCQGILTSSLEYSAEGIPVFNGNQDQNTVVYNILSPPITTRYIRLKPLAWNDRISMRMEIYGCPVDAVFYGNQDSDTVVKNVLIPPITARYIRLMPVEWHNHILMRVEIYGCSVFTGSPTVPPSEMTTEANTDKEGGILGAQQGNRKTEGVNALAVVLPLVIILIAVVALGVFFYWKRRGQKNVDINTVAFQT